MFDLVVRGGTVVDGTGAPEVSADVGVRDGRTVGTSALYGKAKTVVDAEDLVATPGFVDPRTCYDAQLLWDPTTLPSNVHGVTTIIGGNCGSPLDPLDPDGADYLRRMMVKVEGVPLEALEKGPTGPGATSVSTSAASKGAGWAPKRASSSARSDAGAHLDRMCGAPYPSVFLADCLRGRRRLPVEEAVRLMASVPTDLFGLRHRGRITTGAVADLGGVETVRDGAATGALQGHMLRSGRDTDTVAVG